MPTATSRRLKMFKPVSFKAEGQTDNGTTLGPGEFIALASVFNNVDRYHERMIPGAFADTLKAWADSGDPIPVIWQHDWADPFAHIGQVLDIKETDEGLWYKGLLDIENNAFAAQVYGLMKGRRITQQSFGYDVLDAREVVEDKDYIYEITKVDLYEVGPCLVGVNGATELLGVGKARASIGSLGAPVLEREIPEPSGQAKADAAGNEETVSKPSTPDSAPAPAPASKGMSPASAVLALEIMSMEDEL